MRLQLIIFNKLNLIFRLKISTSIFYFKFLTYLPHIIFISVFLTLKFSLNYLIRKFKRAITFALPAIRGCSIVWLVFEVWDFATAVQIRASPFKIKFFSYQSVWKTLIGIFKNTPSGYQIW